MLCKLNRKRLNILLNLALNTDFHNTLRQFAYLTERPGHRWNAGDAFDAERIVPPRPSFPTQIVGQRDLAGAPKLQFLCGFPLIELAPFDPLTK